MCQWSNDALGCYGCACHCMKSLLIDDMRRLNRFREAFQYFKNILGDINFFVDG
jgi:hypothetical protein